MAEYDKLYLHPHQILKGMLEDKKILITGGAGFIAYHLAAALIGKGMEVSLLDNFNNFYDPEIKRRNVRDLQATGRVRMHIVDILDRDKLRHAFEDNFLDGVVRPFNPARDSSIKRAVVVREAAQQLQDFGAHPCLTRFRFAHRANPRHSGLALGKLLLRDPVHPLE